MKDWRTIHPPRGCCVPSCPLFGYCHDECGERTRLVTHTSVKDGYVRGEPVVWIPRHRLNGRVRVPGCFSLQGIPSKQVAPLAKWLHDHYGTWDSAAKATGIPSPTLRGIRRRRRVSPRTVKVVTDAVLAHRRPPDPLRIYELDEPPRRLPGPNRREWNPKRGLFLARDRAKPVARRIIRHLGGITPAARALADFYAIDHRAAYKVLHRAQKGETKVRQGTLDHLEDFAEYCRTEIERVA